ncbi:hypothetical protein PVAG01_05768 [Phlyctema vagabunda]|uniref:Uncharacterized protein n=1 Tax=Phlyctema vagabunda TaxID=108571 RepID=A0ABR4PEQ9_9HELO
MKKNDVIALIIILLFSILAAISFGIYKLVAAARAPGLSSSSGSGSGSGSLADD